MEAEKAAILVKLARHRYWGGRHTSVDNLPKGAPRDRWGQIKKYVDDLIKEGFLITKPTNVGLHVSLNPRKKAEIDKAILEFAKVQNL